MKILRLILLMILLTALAVPVMGNGPDYGTAQKNGTISLSGGSPDSVTFPVIQYPNYGLDDLVRTKIRFNVTNKKYPNIFTIPNVEATTLNPGGWTGINPVQETKLVYKESGTTHVLFNLTLRAYKQASGYVNLYGDFTYVNSIYMGTLSGADIVTDYPTVIYDNITDSGGATRDYTFVVSDAGTNITHVSDYAGFYFQAHPAPGFAASTWVSDTGTINFVSGLNSEIEYGVTNNPITFDKTVMILRPNGEQSHLQIYNNSGVGGAEQLIYESVSRANNETLQFLDTPALYKIWVNVTALNYTIFDDRITTAIPTTGTGTITVYTKDCSTGSLFNGALVSFVDIWDSAWTGYGYTGTLGYPGRIDFDSQPYSEYNITASAIGYSTGYANVTLASALEATTICLYPSSSGSTLEFYITSNLTGNPITGVPVQIQNTTNTLTKMSLAGFARFSTVSGTNYDYYIARDAGACAGCPDTPDCSGSYIPVAGNETATAGNKLVPVVLSLCGELDTGTDDDTITDPHAAAESVMEMIYNMLPSLLMIVFLMLFIGAIDQRRRKR